jgi:curved DNA-binding protein CbpA
VASQRTFYEILGLDPSANREQVREAFRRLARDRHPDRFLGQSRQDAEREFQLITEAYNVLSDQDQRARYDQLLPSLQQPRRVTDRREVARALLAKAVGAMKLGQHTEAQEYFSQAVAHDPDSPKAHHLYGLFLAQQVGKLDEALRQVDQAVRLDPNNVRILLDASRLFARAKMFARARRLGQMAAQLSPGDPGVEAWLVQLGDAGRDRAGT